MHDTATVAPPTVGVRVQSIDLLRGLDVLLMLFVNDIAGVPGTPSFLKHVPASVDGMTITDVVFPAFLFITGMSIPLALGGRLRCGDARAAIWRHVLARALSLIVIGVFMVNAEYATEGGPIPPAVWNVLMTLAVVLVWRVPPSTAPATRAAAATSILRSSRMWIVGAVILVLLALMYHGGSALAADSFRPRWWGILGLIGWAYLPAATIYLLASPRRSDSPDVSRLLAILAGAAALFYTLSILGRMGHLAWLGPARSYVSVALGTQTAVALCGVILTVLLQRHTEAARPRNAFVPVALGYAAALGAASLLLHAFSDVHQAFWFSKLQGSAAWGLASSALTAAAWAALFMLVDVRGWRRWPTIVSTAGELALLIYLAAPFLLSLFTLSARATGVNWYAALSQPTMVGFARAMVFAWFTVSLCGWLRARDVRVRL